MARHLVRSVAATGLAVGAIFLAGCSSGQAAPVAVNTGSGAAAGVASSAAAVSGPISDGTLDVSKLCAAVPTADVQKIVKATIGPATVNPGECDWASGGITVDIYPGDTNKQYYNGGAVDNGTSISGIGDIAQWSAPVAGATLPFLACQHGSLTVTVSPGLDVSDSTIAYTGTAPFYKIAAADTVQYAAEEGQICKDIFNATG